MGDRRRGGRAYRWVDGKPTPLELPAGTKDAFAIEDANADGSLAVGWIGTSSERVCRWRDGKLTILPLPSEAFSGEALGVAVDGTTVGLVTTRGGKRAYVWGPDGAGRHQPVPSSSALSDDATARAISADGKTIVGSVDRARSDTGSEAWVWTPVGSRLLQPRPIFDATPTGISANGTVILYVGAESSSGGSTGVAVLTSRSGKGETLIPPKGRVAFFSRPRLDASGRIVLLALNGQGDAGPMTLWSRASGFVPLRAAMITAMPKGDSLADADDLARFPDGRVRFAGKTTKGVAFVGTVTFGG